MEKLSTYYKEINDRDAGIQIDTRFEKNGDSLIFLKGYLDTDNSNQFMEASLKMLTGETGIKRLLINMRDLNYASSTGIGSLTNILVQSQRAGIELALIEVSEKVKSVMDLLGFTDFFTIMEAP